jgi:nitrate/TMAO reductase-like tetraheme cytochrome c subunit
MQFPRIDLNDPKQRSAIVMFVVLTVFVILPAVAVSAFHGYHYTDSTEFCSDACHAIMEPQAIAFQHSPRARAECAECHIGSGATSFVKAKVSGTRRGLAVLTESFQRPHPPRHRVAASSAGNVRRASLA